MSFTNNKMEWNKSISFRLWHLNQVQSHTENKEHAHFKQQQQKYDLRARLLVPIPPHLENAFCGIFVVDCGIYCFCVYIATH